MSETKTQHTPGPWEVRARRDDQVNGGTYRSLYSQNPGGWLGDIRAGSGEEDANARLIAKAPEMLELLKEFAYGDNRAIGDAVSEAWRLIAETEGEKPLDNH